MARKENPKKGTKQKKRGPSLSLISNWDPYHWDPDIGTGKIFDLGYGP